jgi:chaperonin GroES
VTIRPLRDRILICRDQREKISRGGIVIPETAKRDKPQKGTVLAVGRGTPHATAIGQVYYEPPSVKPGDVVLHTKYAGEGILVGDEEVFLVKEEELIAVIDEDEDEDEEIETVHIDAVA